MARRPYRSERARPLDASAMITGQLDPPKPFGRFMLTARIAAGGMATVYRAEVLPADVLHGRLLALKVLHDHLADNAEFIRMFKDEGRIVQQFEHPNVVRVHEVGETYGQHYLAMELVQGRDLGQILQAHRILRQVMATPVAFEILRQALTGLRYVHDFRSSTGRTYGIVHRDISPQNLLVSSEPLVKITDFGIARGEHQSQRSRTGTVKGKMHYMAPEQAAGGVVDGRADLYSLGAVAFEMFTGHPLFGRGSTEVLQQRAIRGEIEWGERFRNLPDDVRRWLQKALATRLEDRYFSADAMLADMEHLAGASRARYDPQALLRMVGLNEARRSVQQAQPLLYADDDGRPRPALAPNAGPPQPLRPSTLPPGTYADLAPAERRARLRNATGDSRVDWRVAEPELRPASEVRERAPVSEVRKSRSRANLLPAEAAVGKSYEPDAVVARGTPDGADAAARPATGSAVDALRPSSLRNPKPVGDDHAAAEHAPLAAGPPTRTRAATKVDPERVAAQRGMALASFAAWGCGALVMLAVVLEVVGAKVELPEANDALVASLFDDAPGTRTDAVQRSGLRASGARQAGVPRGMPQFRPAELPEPATRAVASVELQFPSVANGRPAVAQAAPARKTDRTLTPEDIAARERAAQRAVSRNAERMAWAGRPIERVERPDARPRLEPSALASPVARPTPPVPRPTPANARSAPAIARSAPANARSAPAIARPAPAIARLTRAHARPTPAKAPAATTAPPQRAVAKAAPAKGKVLAKPVGRVQPKAQLPVAKRPATARNPRPKGRAVASAAPARHAPQPVPSRRAP
ncbi:MAG: serine/threonine protein kinase [Myxococcales bacterium]|nr:serine/threonine protein kinase [Myxococcales bacterium]